MKDQTTKNPSGKPGCLCKNNQRGALLIALIITMVIFSALGAAVLYIFSSSTLNPVSGNYAQRAYYNAEAGYNFVISRVRNEGKSAVLATYGCSDDGGVLICPSEASRTLTLPGGGTAAVLITGVTAATYTPVTATSTYNSTDRTLTLTSVTGGDWPAAPGFFKKSGKGTTIYRYTKKETDASGTITLSFISPGITTGGQIETIETAKITSTGSFGSGLWQARRTVEYTTPIIGRIQPGIDDLEELPATFGDSIADATQLLVDAAALGTAIEDLFDKAGIPYVDLTPLDIRNLSDWAAAGLPMAVKYMLGNYGLFKLEEVDGNNAFKIYNVNRLVLPYEPYDNAFHDACVASGDSTLSYDGQAKFKIGSDLSEAGNFLVGLTLRADFRTIGSSPVGTNNYNQFGISYAKKYQGLVGNAFWPEQAILESLPTKQDIYAVLWKNSNLNYHLIASKKLTVADGVISQDIYFEDDMENAATSATNWPSAPSAWTRVSDTGTPRLTPTTAYRGVLTSSEPKLTFRYKKEDFGVVANFNVQLYYGSGWVDLMAIELYNDDWQSKSLTIPTAIFGDKNLKIRFNLYKGGTKNPKLYIDDVNVGDAWSDDMEDAAISAANWPSPPGDWTRVSKDGSMTYQGYETDSLSTTRLTSKTFDLDGVQSSQSLTSKAFAIPDVAVAQLVFYHKMTDYHLGDAGHVEICKGSCTSWTTLRRSDLVTGGYYIGNRGWEEDVLEIPDSFRNQSDVKIRFRVQSTLFNLFVYGSPKWYIDDVKVVSGAKLKDWSTILARINETTSVNNLEVFFGHATPAFNPSTGTAADTNARNIVRAANPRSSGYWPPGSPINSLSADGDKFTLVSSSSSDTNPWVWGDGTAATLGSTYTVNSCTYTLTSGGTQETSAVITTTCRKTVSCDTLIKDDYSLDGGWEEFGVHVMTPNADITDNWAWVDDIGINLVNGGTIPYVPGVQQ